MKCEYCGTDNPEQVAYCCMCGRSVKERSTDLMPNMASRSTLASTPQKAIDWTPLLIVMGAVYLISSSIVLSTMTNTGYWAYDFKLEFQINTVLFFVAGTILITAIALVIYSRIDLAKTMLVWGMICVVLMLAIRTEVYLRAMW
jgi:cell division protein FtsW (lipid II flippase)